MAPPRIPIMSTVTADWLTDAEARNPRYWGEHLRKPVLFAPAAARLLADPRRMLVEIGPRAAMSALATQAVGHRRGRCVAMPSLSDEPSRECEASREHWARCGPRVSTSTGPRYSRHESRRRVPLPGYPFERQRHWVDAPVAGRAAAIQGRSDAMAASDQPFSLRLPAAAGAMASPETMPRSERLLRDLQVLVEEVSGIDIGGADPAVLGSSWAWIR